ncbi:MAG: class I SAM-dependent methyltransferase [Pleurocapsa minor HA4230-MV1]|jgi:2-polyprenyl-3-methyl-5-hydroxy-6-metoxy-1,4-benzoquinol methylase|nr:class I SAM-dependent methyltransferase [Pleurocapsa minor HA4230-MV1]
MPTVKQHYANVLADVYAWMLGGFDFALNKHTEFFRLNNISPQASGIAIDLGAGCGFQSIPLANLGFSVTAIDLDQKLLNELKANASNLNITTIQDDLINFEQYVDNQAELIVCMTDTLLHLESKRMSENSILLCLDPIRSPLAPLNKGDLGGSTHWKRSN